MGRGRPHGVPEKRNHGHQLVVKVSANQMEGWEVCWRERQPPLTIGSNIIETDVNLLDGPEESQVRSRSLGSFGTNGVAA